MFSAAHPSQSWKSSHSDRFSNSGTDEVMSAILSKLSSIVITCGPCFHLFTNASVQVLSCEIRKMSDSIYVFPAFRNLRSPFEYVLYVCLDEHHSPPFNLQGPKDFSWIVCVCRSANSVSGRYMCGVVFLWTARLELRGRKQNKR